MKRVVAFSGVGMLLLLSIHTTQNMIADVYASMSKSAIATNKYSMKSLSDKKRNQLLGYIETSRILNPFSSENLEYFLMLQQYGFQDTSSKEGLNREQLKEMYREIISSRPARVYNWLNFVIFKANIQEFDSEFLKVFKKTKELSEWKRDVEIELLRVGLITWYQLDGQAKALVIDTLEIALIKQQKSVINMVKKERANVVVCANIADQYRKLAQCESALLI